VGVARKRECEEIKRSRIEGINEARARGDWGNESKGERKQSQERCGARERETFLKSYCT
jgi:hypothetical protein